MFKDFEDFKRQATFYPKGTVVPENVMLILQKGPNGTWSEFEARDGFIFGNDTYVVNTHGTNFIIPENPAYDFPGADIVGHKPDDAVVKLIDGKGKDLSISAPPAVEHGNFIVGWGDHIADPIKYVNRIIESIQSGRLSK